MTNNDILLTNYLLLQKCVKIQMNKYSIDKSMYEDLLQTMSLIILEYDNDKLNNVVKNKHMNAFITAILKNQLYSKTSPFYKKHIQFNKNSLSLNEIYSI